MARFARTETERPDISVAVASFDQQTSSAGGGLILLVQAQGGGLILLVQSTRVTDCTERDEAMVEKVRGHDL